MMNEKQALGKWGETEAIKLLKAKGLEVIEANWSFLHLEIDVVAKDRGTLVIVEVKTRGTDAFGDPEMFVSRAKQKKLIRAANWYLQNKNLDLEIRFDVIGVVNHFDGIRIRHIPNAFHPID
jgi:putative endonuclease